MKACHATLLVLGVLVLLAGPARGAAPSLVNYQGTLCDTNGIPLDGPHDLVFKIYAAPGSNDALWTERHAAVLVDRGLFHVILGSVDPVANPLPTDLFNGGERWLGLGVDDGAELQPRMQFTSVPWAMRATVADSALTTSGSGDADWQFAGDDIYRLGGNVGIGTATPAKRLQVDQGNDASQGFRIASGSDYSSVYADFMVTRGAGGLVINSNAGGGSWADLSLQTNGLTKVFVEHDGRVGIGTSAPAKLLHIDQNNDLTEGIRLASGSAYSNVYADFMVTRGNGGLVINSNAGGGSWADISLQTNGSTRVFVDQVGNVGIGTTSPQNRLHVEGEARVDVLHITGADVAERFPVAATVPAGTVVSIDADRPGQLCMSDRAYDRRVAGVVSGAGELPTGAVLGHLDDKGPAVPVALSGRVWVQCDASAGPIVPGDLLTSADRPGHAMQAADHDRAQGAIIGKAMTGLATGQGLVLVLVSLQ